MSRIRSLIDQLPPTLVDRARPTAVKARQLARDRGLLASPASSDHASPYRLWHGPELLDSSAGFTAKVVADIVSFQGRAAPNVEVALEIETGPASTRRIAVPHRFAHPDDPKSPPDCFELSLDSATLKNTTRARLVVDTTAGPWHDLPTVPTPNVPSDLETIEQCPACGSSNFVPCGRRQQLQMVTCQRCQLVMTSPRPSEERTLTRYSDRYFEEEYLPSQELSPGLSAHIDAILDRAEPSRSIGPNLFELGVGGGNLLHRAQERGWDVHDSDVNEASVRHAQGRGLNVWHENADHATTLKGPYSAVISEMSLEHVRRPDHFCRLAHASMQPGGRLVIFTVSAEGWSFEHAGMASPLVGPGEHLFLFSAGSLVALVESAGFRVESLWRQHRADEIGIVAVKRTDYRSPALRSGS